MADKKREDIPGKNPRGNYQIWVILATLVVVLGVMYLSQASNIATIDYSEFQDMVTERNVQKVVLIKSQRGGHIPGASNIPWAKACNDDGTFKSRDELEAIYKAAGITGTKPIIAYCRIGERSSHSWFVLSHLLGYKNVTNYDGSWTEWGNLVGAPVEKGAAAATA
jgi:thiosulfate/3-mercaptopyruvate sulfurtransferase